MFKFFTDIMNAGGRELRRLEFLISPKHFKYTKNLETAFQGPCASGDQDLSLTPRRTATSKAVVQLHSPVRRRLMKAGRDQQLTPRPSQRNVNTVLFLEAFVTIYYLGFV